MDLFWIQEQIARNHAFVGKFVCMVLPIQEDHIHMVCSIPPKLSVSEYMGVLKGKSAIKLFKSYPKFKKKPYWGNHFWARGCFVSTVEIDEEKIKRYVKYQEGEEREEERHQDEFDLFQR